MGHSNNIIRQKVEFYTLRTSPELFLWSVAWDELACSLLGSPWFIQTIWMNLGSFCGIEKYSGSPLSEELPLYDY